MRVIGLVLAAALFMSAHGCAQITKEAVLGVYEGAISIMGGIAVTPDIFLIGERDNIDGYTGSYTAECTRKTGTDVIFGGTSTKERNVTVTAVISSESGTATVTVSSGGKLRILVPDGNGVIEETVTLNGSSSITVGYDGFSGKVMLAVGY